MPIRTPLGLGELLESLSRFTFLKQLTRSTTERTEKDHPCAPRVDRPNHWLGDRGPSDESDLVCSNPSTANAWPANRTKQQFPSSGRRAVPTVYKGETPPLAPRADSLVGVRILVEITPLSAILPVHETPLLTYLRLSPIQVGLLMNFRAVRQKD